MTGTVGTCRSCGATVWWAQTDKGRRMPIDPEPVEDGTLRRYWQGAVLAVTVDPAYDGPKYRSHFASCPQAEAHRKRART